MGLTGHEAQLIGGISTVVYTAPLAIILILIVSGRFFMLKFGIRLQSPPLTASRAALQQQSVFICTSSRQLLFFALFMNILFSTIDGTSISVRKLLAFSLTSDECTFLTRIDRISFSVAKLFSLFFFGVRAIVIRERETERRHVYAALAIILSGFAVFAIVWISSSFGIIDPGFGCVTASSDVLVDTYLLNPVDFVTHMALLLIFILPLRQILVTNSGWNINSQSSDRYAQLLRETLIVSSISIGFTQVILMILMLNYFLRNLDLALITSPMFTLDLLVTALCQLFVIRKSWELRIGARSWFGTPSVEEEKSNPLLMRNSRISRFASRSATTLGGGPDDVMMSRKISMSSRKTGGVDLKKIPEGSDGQNSGPHNFPSQQTLTASGPPSPANNSQGSTEMVDPSSRIPHLSGSLHKI
eukprot:TRINITY_DN3548_c0_g1_i1.p1 TRINITY_DN3548_c0_g1~~TRINITY_DN3548_c0_g1_i1.p1  ORF type:complete len:416 (-),score=94.07 TRINITY_DN3548_c0_g1_i1:348-1595(-)